MFVTVGTRCEIGLHAWLLSVTRSQVPSGEAQPPVFYSDQFLCQRRWFETGQIGFRVGRVLGARATNVIGLHLWQLHLNCAAL
jgi:hypothetical protein